MSDAVNCVDLSHLNMTDHDLERIIQSFAKKASNQFDGITSVNLSNNMLTNNKNIRDLLILFKNVRVVNLSNSGLAPSNNMSTSASVIWFDNAIDDEEESGLHSDDSFDFMDDDDEESDDENVVDSDSNVIAEEEDEIDDDFFMDFDDTDHENSLQIEYSLNLHTADTFW